MVTVHTPFPKIVHLDLKGAPPSLAYLRQLLPLLVEWGATGLLLEYEDAFPYHGALQMLRSVSAYDMEELRAFLLECRAMRLDIIPLVQTFGHMEFVLKHTAHKPLREHSWYANSICPSNEASLAVIAQMIDQIVDAHQDVSTVIHIGCDEVHQLGVCPLCEQRMAHRGWAKHRLFAEHVTRVATYVKSRVPWRVLIWDDMLRGVDFRNNIQPTGLTSCVEPVVWYYGAQAVPDVWNTLSAYQGVWAASAYKGASGANETTADTALHVCNHKLWVAVLNDRSGSTSLGGIILTGWSRYDHFSVLCELLPAGIPSLALALHILKHGGFNALAHKTASVAVGFTGEQLMPIVQRPRPVPIDSDWAFPGSGVFIGSQRHANLVCHTQEGFLNADWLRAWFCEYNEVRGHVNEGMAQQLYDRAGELLAEWRSMGDYMSSAMSAIYSRYTIDEWLGNHVLPHTNRLQETRQRLSKHLPTRI